MKKSKSLESLDNDKVKHKLDKFSGKNKVCCDNSDSCECTNSSCEDHIMDKPESVSMVKMASVQMDQLTPARVTSKLKKFGLGKDGVKSKNKTESKDDKTAKQKEEEGKLMVDDEDKKVELEYKTITETMHMAGGPVSWIFIVLSFFITSGYSKWVNFETKSIFIDAPETNSTANATATHDDGEGFNA